MTAEELAGALAHQRHELVDLDPDSAAREWTDPNLCAHGRPILLAQATCRDCAECPPVHEIKTVRPVTETGRTLTEWCQNCGRSLGLHGRE